MARAINAAICCAVLAVVLRLFRKDGRWSPGRGAKAFRYFTVQSNALCGVAALCMCVAPDREWAWLLKYVATAAVTVTMLTVLLFLGPTKGYDRMLRGVDLVMHLVTPPLAIFSFCVLEKRGLSPAAALWGMLPPALYGPLYLYRIALAPPDARWEDFYGFNRGGRWPLAFAAMLLGALAVCAGLMALQNA